MHSQFQLGHSGDTQILPRSRALLLLLVVFLFVAALGIRLYKINQPYLDFAAVREYHSLLIVRAWYFEADPSIPEWRQQVATLAAERPYYLLEPPILEGMTLIGYRITGGEHIWIPRLLSTVFWLIGGVFLYLILRKVVSTDATVLCTVVYLFAPLGVAGSRAFMPDALMVMMLLVSILAMLRYHDNPSTGKLLIAAAASAFAILVKPMCVFPIFGTFIALAIFIQGIRRSLLGRDLLTFIVVSITPAFIYYLYGTLFTAAADEYFAQGIFRPHLWLTMHFWELWRNQVVNVVSQGYILLILGLHGILFSSDRRMKILVAGLWVSYFMYGLVFTTHIGTHPYYSLPLVPILAISLGPAFDLIVDRLSRVRTRLHLRMAVFALLTTLTLVLVTNLFYWHYYIGGYYINSSVSEYSTQIRIAQEIGERVGHSTNTIFLDYKRGVRLEYYGEMSGFYWTEIWAPDFKGGVNAEERFYRDYAQYSPDYFIVTNFDELDRQPDLRVFLGRFPVLVKNADYVIYDLRNKTP